MGETLKSDSAGNSGAPATQQLNPSRVMWGIEAVSKLDTTKLKDMAARMVAAQMTNPSASWPGIGKSAMSYAFTGVVPVAGILKTAVTLPMSLAVQGADFFASFSGMAPSGQIAQNAQAGFTNMFRNAPGGVAGAWNNFTNWALAIGVGDQPRAILHSMKNGWSISQPPVVSVTSGTAPISTINTKDE